MPEKKGEIYETKNESICPECGSKDIEVTEEDYNFTYGIAQEAVDLTARVPVHNCKSCGGKFLDAIADDICHEKICRHLGVMTPSEIKEIRTGYNLSQAEFCEITKLGEATLSRWERGAIVQNQAYDNYLYLLKYPENFERVHSHKESKNENNSPVEPTFKVIKITEELIRQSREFKLVGT